MSETIAAAKPLGVLIGEPLPTWRSERALDATTFCLADVADGLGPFRVIYLTTSRHWTATDAGYAMSAMLIGTVLSQTFVGAWIGKIVDAAGYSAGFVFLSAVAVLAFVVLFTTFKETKQA